MVPGYEEPMSDEVLREMCDKNYHQLLPLIAEKMQKEKEQKDRLNAVKARLIYGEESGVKIRNNEESHTQNPKPPNRQYRPRRSHGGRPFRKPFTTHQVYSKGLRRKVPPSPQPRPRKRRGAWFEDWVEEPVKRLATRQTLLVQLANIRRRVRTVEGVGRGGEGGVGRWAGLGGGRGAGRVYDGGRGEARGNGGVRGKWGRWAEGAWRVRESRRCEDDRYGVEVGCVRGGVAVTEGRGTEEACGGVRRGRGYGEAIGLSGHGRMVGL
ncbi:hypothetical protein Tco_0555868 [Tanacetum coccineum]